MIINNLLIRLKDKDSENIARTRAVLLSMKGKIKPLIDIQVEINIRSGASAYDLMLITKFASQEDMDAYLADPVHQEVAQYIAGVLETGASLCYESQKC